MECCNIRCLAGPGNTIASSTDHDHSSGARPNFRAAFVVADDCHLRNPILLNLRDQGWIVHRIRSTEHVFPILARIPYELIIVDSELPGIDGKDFVHLLRNAGEWRAILPESKTANQSFRYSGFSQRGESRGLIEVVVHGRCHGDHPRVTQKSEPSSSWRSPSLDRRADVSVKACAKLRYAEPFLASRSNATRSDVWFFYIVIWPSRRSFLIACLDYLLEFGR